MVKYGDILCAEEKYIVHQTNCVISTKGYGLSLDIFNKYPYSDCYLTRKEKDFPGTIDIRGNGLNERYIINLMGQYYPGKAKYSNDTNEKRMKFFNEGLKKIFEIKDLKSVAFPYKIGCGKAGGDWKEYKHSIIEMSKKYPEISVIIYKKIDYYYVRCAKNPSSLAGD